GQATIDMDMAMAAVILYFRLQSESSAAMIPAASPAAQANPLD
ncbi:hypothetical protein A2U01_0115222, partial [Trifolium medium]|nr:hypothetical protein [Trifolium medium]